MISQKRFGPGVAVLVGDLYPVVHNTDSDADAAAAVRDGQHVIDDLRPVMIDGTRPSHYELAGFDNMVWALALNGVAAIGLAGQQVAGERNCRGQLYIENY